MRSPLKGHKRLYIKSTRHVGNTYSYSVKCECGWSRFLNNSKQRSAVEAHRDHKDHVVWLAGHCANCAAEMDYGPGPCDECASKVIVLVPDANPIPQNITDALYGPLDVPLVCETTSDCERVVVSDWCGLTHCREHAAITHMSI
jgi:hypothetical protein